MADKSVGELIKAQAVYPQDLWLCEQSGVAKAVTGQVLINMLTSIADGHGGIKSSRIVPGPGRLQFKIILTLADTTEIEIPMTNGRGIQSIRKTSTSGLVDTYTVTYTDDTTSQIKVTNGRGVQSFGKTSTSGLTDTYTLTYTDGTTSRLIVTNGRSIQSVRKTNSVGLVDTYTITYNDGGPASTFTVTNGDKGDKGDNTYTWVKFADRDPSEPPHSMGDIPGPWLGIYWGSAAKAPSLWSDYNWYEIKGEKGDTGAAATVTQAKTEYQVSSSGTAVPIGPWTAEVPPVPQGAYLWARQTLRFNSGNPLISYNVTRYGMDGLGTVNSVDGVQAAPGGNVPLGAWRQINGKKPAPDGSGTFEAADVGAATKEQVLSASPNYLNQTTLYTSDEVGEFEFDVVAPGNGYIYLICENGASQNNLQYRVVIGGVGIAQGTTSAPAYAKLCLGPTPVKKGDSIHAQFTSSGPKRLRFLEKKV